MGRVGGQKSTKGSRAAPFDFEEESRSSQELDLWHHLAILGRFGVDSAWGMMRTGAQNPREDGADNLNWDGAENEHDSDTEPPQQTKSEEDDTELTSQPDTGTDAKKPQEESRCGGLDEDMTRKFDLAFSQSKLEAIFSGLAASTRVSYQSSRLYCGRFCFVRGSPIWLRPGEPGWGEPLLGFLIWTIKVFGRSSSTLKTRFAAIRLTHLVNGNVDFPLQAQRANDMMKGLEKREGVLRKRPLTLIFCSGCNGNW